MDQATFLLNNQYDLDLLDRAYHTIRNTTWDHCMNAQAATCKQKLFGGVVQDFKLDAELNKKMGFPEGSYTHFLPYRLLQGNQKYILEHFIKGKELLTLRDMLQNNRFPEQYMFHFADYIFMNLKCRIIQEGTYMVIPVGTPDGITQEFMDYIMSNYDDGYSQNRWYLEIRPKVSYAYAESTTMVLFENEKIYLSSFPEHREYYKSDAINDWKVCVSDRSDNLPLMRMTSATLGDDTDGRGPYLLVSGTFAEYIQKSTFNLNCFLFNEGHKVGHTISPNYIGPTGFLKTTFGEYLATIDSQRLKVVAMDYDGGWTSLEGKDKQFAETVDLVVVGFARDWCWIAIPTKDGVSPIYPANFRVWEYDAERDTIGRMVATDMYVQYPNIYFYKMKSDSAMLYLEWFRDDELVGSTYKDTTKEYRDYVGTNFYDSLLTNTLPATVQNFTPYHSVFDTTDLCKRLLLYSSHEYRVEEMTRLLHETGLEYSTLFTMLSVMNKRYDTITYKMAEMPELYTRLSTAEEPYICISCSGTELRPYDLYIDGLHVGQTRTFWREFNQYVTLPKGSVNENSVIIVDLYESQMQQQCDVNVLRGFTEALIPAGFSKKVNAISGNDLVITDSNGVRIPGSRISYGLYAQELYVQVPFSDIDWDELGIDPNDPALVDRIGIQVDTQDFKSVVFRLIVPMEYSYTKLLTATGEELYTNQRELLLVKGGVVILDTTDMVKPVGMEVGNLESFTKRVDPKNVAVHVADYTDPTGFVRVYNCDVYRMAIIRDLSVNSVATIPSYSGADDSNRLMPFVNGVLCRNDEVTGAIPLIINSDFHITFNGTYNAGDKAEVVYAPFPMDRFDVTSDAYSQLNLAGTGVMCVMPNDIVFENGRRIDAKSLVPITNQIVKAPSSGATYTIIRVHRDGNLYNFEDTDNQSFLDKLIKESPGFKAKLGIH